MNNSAQSVLSFMKYAIFLTILLAGVWCYSAGALTGDKTGGPGPAAPALPSVKPRGAHALGRLEPRGGVLQISAPSGNEGARIEQLLVEEGQDVAAGQILAILDSFGRRQAAVAEAEAQLNAARARLAQIRAGARAGEISAQAAQVERMEVDVAFTQRELERARLLTARQALSKEELDARQRACDCALLDLRRSQAQLASLREVREVDVELQLCEIAVAQTVLDRARADLDAARIRTTAAGRILKIHAHPGERIENQGVVQLADVRRMQAVAEVFEGDVSLLQVGMAARIQLSSFGAAIPGTVAQLGLLVARKDLLSNDPVSDTDARVVEVRIDLDPADIPRVERLANSRVEVTFESSPQPSLTAAEATPAAR